MRCLVCEHDDWENVDQYRYTKKDMSMCKNCGFVSYPSKYKTKEEILEYYRNDYRQPPSIENMFTGTKKLYYHEAFLQDVFKVWKDKSKIDPVVSDVGAAYGLLLNWLRSIRDQKTGKVLFPKIDLNGVELTLSFRRNAYHEFGLDLKEDFDDSKTYDLISSYKVAEHMLDFDLELERYHKSLKHDGFLYISVPTWWGKLHNFGMEGFDLEYYLIPDHINVWHVSHFEYLLKKKGFKIVKEDHSMYDDTYLCIKDTDLKPVVLEDECISPKEVKRCLAAVKKATDLLLQTKFQEAIEVWPNFSIAWRGLYELKKPEFHKKGYKWIKETILEKAISIDPTNMDFISLAADVAMRYSQWDDALDYLGKGSKMRPKDPSFLANIANCYRSMAREAPSFEKKIEYTKAARDLCRFLMQHQPQVYNQSINWIYQDNANLPTEFEFKEASSG